MTQPIPKSKQYLAAATTHFDQLKTIFKKGAHNTLDEPAEGINLNFWQLGCVFDTMLDYFWVKQELNDDVPSDEISDVIADAKHGYIYGITANMAVWYDDWSWFGIASSKAFDPAYASFFGEEKEFFQQVALNLWGLVNAGDYKAVATHITKVAPDAWPTNSDTYHFLNEAGLSQRAEYHHGTTKSWANLKDGAAPPENRSFFTKAGANWAVPRFDNRTATKKEPIYYGCWQYDMYSQKLNLACWDGNAEQFPYPSQAPVHQGPFQFTLMSGLYTVFAARLAKASDAVANNPKLSTLKLESADTYKQCAEPVYQFLNKWYEIEDKDYALFKKDSSTKLLIRERMPTYAACPDCTKADGYIWGIHKSTDGTKYPIVQGFSPKNFWGGDQGLMINSFLAYPKDDSLASTLTAENLVDGVEADMTNSQNVVKAYQGPIFSDDPNDYGSGSGIFWRYVLYGCRTDKGDKSFNAHLVSKIKNNPSDNFIGGSADNLDQALGNRLFKPFNKVAVTIAASYIWKQYEDKYKKSAKSK